MLAGSLEIEIMANMARLQADMNDAKKAVGSAMDDIKKSAANAMQFLGGVFSAKMFSDWVKGAIDAADKLDDLAEKSGIATKQLSILRFAGEAVGTPVDSLATGVQKLAVNMAAAAGGAKEQGRLFKTLGVEFKNSDGSLRSSDKVLGELADKFAHFRDGPEKAALAVAVFGKSGAEMIPLLNQGSEGIEKLRSEAERFGAVIDVDTAKAMADFNDNLTKLRLSSEGTALAIAREVVPTLNDLLGILLDSKQAGEGWGTIMGKAVRIVIEALTVLGANVKFVLEGMGRELGSWAAQISALAHLDIDGFHAISDAVKADGIRAREELDELEARILKLGRGSAWTNALSGLGNFAGGMIDDKVSAPVVKGSEGGGSKVDKAAADALAAELERYKEFDKAIVEERKDFFAELALAAKLGKKTEEDVIQAQLQRETEVLAARKEIANQELDLIRTKENSKKEQQTVLGKIAGFERDLVEAQKKAAGELALLDKARMDVLDAQFDAASKAASAAQDAVYAQERENQVLGLGFAEAAKGAAGSTYALTIKVGELQKAWAYETAAQLERQAVTARGKDLNDGTAKKLEEQAATLRKLADMKFTGVQIDNSTNALKSINDYLDPARAQDFGQALADAFGSAGDAMGKLVNAFGQYQQKQAELQKFKDQLPAINDPEVRAQQEIALGKMSAKIQINNFGNIAGAAKGFFKEHSKGYKAMEAAERTFRAFEMAMAAEAMVRQLFGIQTVTGAKVAGAIAETVAVDATVAPTVLAETTKQGAFSITALAAALAGPWPANIAAFATVAAMLAAIGVAVSGGGGGGKDSGYKGIAAAGTGTVLGMEGEASKSISNSLDMLSENSRIELTVSQRMLSEMTQVKEGVMGLAGKASNDMFIRGMAGGSYGDSFLDSGIAFAPGQSIESIIANGVTAKGFNLIFDKGAKVMAKELDPEFKTGIGRVLGSVFDTIMTAADSLSLNDPDIKARMLSLIPTLGDTSTYAMNGVMGQGGGLVSLKGKTGKEIQEELEAIFSAVGDQMVGAALPSLKVFQRVGEGMFETLVRVTTGIESAKYSLEKFGIAAIDYTAIVRKSGDVATEIIRQSTMALEHGADGALTGVGQILGLFEGTADDLLTLYTTLVDVRAAMRSVGAEGRDLSAMMVRGAGGIEKLQTGLSDYFDGFFSDAEKAAAGQARLAEQFKIIGQAVPSSIQAFRDQVQAIDTSTDAGAKLFGQLMALSGSFADVQAAAKDLADQRAQLEIELMRAQGDEIGAVAAERKAELEALRAVDPALAKMKGQIYALQEAAESLNKSATAFFQTVDYQKSVDSLQSQGTSAIDKFLGHVEQSANALAITNQQLQADAAKAAVSAWNSAADSIRSSLENIRRGSELLFDPAVLYERSKALLDNAATKSMGGDVEAAKVVGSLAESFLSASEKTATSRVDYLRDRALTEAKLAATLDKANAQITIQQAIASASDAMVSQLTLMNANLTGFAAQAFELLSKSYAGVDRGTAEIAVATLASMQAKQDAFFGAYKEGETYKYEGVGGSAEFVRLAGNMAKFIGSDGSTGFFRQTDDILEVAKRIPELRAIWEKQFGIKLPAFAAGGFHDGGWAMVGEQGPELAHFGSSARIYNAVDSSRMMSGSNADLVAEVRELRAAVERGNEDRKLVGAQSIGATKKVAKKLEDLSGGTDRLQAEIVGPPVKVEVVPA